MAFAVLKKIRVAVSLLFFLLISFLFVDFTNSLAPEIVNGILYFQFIPSILKFINLIGVATAGFIFVLILTFLFGRVYCSTFCPLGTLQDISNFFGKKFRKRKFYKYSKPYNWFRYSFLTLIVVFLLFGSILFANLLDPYSNFGKIISNLVRPVYYFLNNVLAGIMQKFEVFIFYKVDIKSYSWLSFGFSLFLLILVIRLSMKKGRLYCNTVCPVGSFLGLISKVSFFKIRLDHTLCNSCGSCGAVCKAQCIDTKNREVDFSRCVGCLNCLTVCPGNGVKFDWRKNPKESSIKPLPKNRREFISKSAILSAGAVAVVKNSFSEGLNDGVIPVVKEYPVSPPGSFSIKHFTHHCTACHLCVSACPTHVLQPSFLHYGLAGMMQPTMDYKASFCNFECTICSEICPTGALLPVDLESKKNTAIGQG